MLNQQRAPFARFVWPRSAGADSTATVIEAGNIGFVSLGFDADHEQQQQQQQQQHQQQQHQRLTQSSRRQTRTSTTNTNVLDVNDARFDMVSPNVQDMLLAGCEDSTGTLSQQQYRSSSLLRNCAGWTAPHRLRQPSYLQSQSQDKSDYPSFLIDNDPYAAFWRRQTKRDRRQDRHITNFIHDNPSAHVPISLLREMLHDDLDVEEMRSQHDWMQGNVLGSWSGIVDEHVDNSTLQALVHPDGDNFDRLAVTFHEQQRPQSASESDGDGDRDGDKDDNSGEDEDENEDEDEEETENEDELDINTYRKSRATAAHSHRSKNGNSGNSGSNGNDSHHSDQQPSKIWSNYRASMKFATPIREIAMKSEADKTVSNKINAAVRTHSGVTFVSLGVDYRKRADGYICRYGPHYLFASEKTVVHSPSPVNTLSGITWNNGAFCDEMALCDSSDTVTLWDVKANKSIQHSLGLPFLPEQLLSSNHSGNNEYNVYDTLSLSRLTKYSQQLPSGGLGWLRAEFCAASPRLLWAHSPYDVKLFDLRSPQHTGSGTGFRSAVFADDHSLRPGIFNNWGYGLTVHPNHVYSIKQSSTHSMHLAVATSNNLTIVDARFPQRPLLQWELSKGLHMEPSSALLTLPASTSSPRSHHEPSIVSIHSKSACVSAFGYGTTTTATTTTRSSANANQPSPVYLSTMAPMMSPSVHSHPSHLLRSMLSVYPSSLADNDFRLRNHITGAYIGSYIPPSMVGATILRHDNSSPAGDDLKMYSLLSDGSIFEQTLSSSSNESEHLGQSRRSEQSTADACHRPSPAPESVGKSELELILSEYTSDSPSFDSRFPYWKPDCPSNPVRIDVGVYSEYLLETLVDIILHNNDITPSSGHSNQDESLTNRVNEIMDIYSKLTKNNSEITTFELYSKRRDIYGHSTKRQVADMNINNKDALQPRLITLSTLSKNNLSFGTLSKNRDLKESLGQYFTSIYPLTKWTSDDYSKQSRLFNTHSDKLLDIDGVLDAMVNDLMLASIKPLPVRTAPTIATVADAGTDVSDTESILLSASTTPTRASRRSYPSSAASTDVDSDWSVQSRSSSKRRNSSKQRLSVTESHDAGDVSGIETPRSTSAASEAFSSGQVESLLKSASSILAGNSRGSERKSRRKVERVRPTGFQFVYLRGAGCSSTSISGLCGQLLLGWEENKETIPADAANQEIAALAESAEPDGLDSTSIAGLELVSDHLPSGARTPSAMSARSMANKAAAGRATETALERSARRTMRKQMQQQRHLEQLSQLSQQVPIPAISSQSFSQSQQSSLDFFDSASQPKLSLPTRQPATTPFKASAVHASRKSSQPGFGPPSTSLSQPTKSTPKTPATRDVLDSSQDTSPPAPMPFSQPLLSAFAATPRSQLGNAPTMSQQSTVKPAKKKARVSGFR